MSFSDHLIAGPEVYQLQGDRAIVNFFFFCNKTSPSQPDWELTASAVFQHGFAGRTGQECFLTLKGPVYTDFIFIARHCF